MPFDLMSVGSTSVNNLSIKAKRRLQIKKLEQEYARLTKRLDQASDPSYILEVKEKLKRAEEERRSKLDFIGKLEV